MSNPALQLQHSINVDVPLPFAWRWRTDINNWDDPPAQFQLEGPFDTGSRGTTVMPGQATIQWQLRDVQAPRWFVVEMTLDRAVLSFEWMFDAISARATLMTQRIVLSGENATSYVDGIRAGFGSTLEPGMRRIATAIERDFEREKGVS